MRAQLWQRNSFRISFIRFIKCFLVGDIDNSWANYIMFGVSAENPNEKFFLQQKSV